MPTVLDRPAIVTAAPPARRPLRGRCALVCKLCGAAHPASAIRHLRRMSRPARAGVRPRPRAARCRHDRRAGADRSGATASGCRSRASRSSPSTAGSRRWSTRPRLARRLGVARVWVKNDAVSHPSLSFKDRVVATALNAALGLGLDTVGCASTGNLANAVAAQAARAGLPAWIFIPHDLEHAKVVGTAVYGPHLVRVRGTYDDVNRLCAAGGRPVRLGPRQHQPPGLLRRGLEDDGLRDRRAARLAAADGGGGADGGRLAAHEAGEGIPRVSGGRPGVGPDAAALRRAGVGLRADRATWSSAAASS